jgi:hypothetical protein
MQCKTAVAGPEPSEPIESADASVNLDATLALSETQLLAQIADETSLDGRTMGLLAFNGALLAADIAAKSVLSTWWWTPLPFLAVATTLCLWSTFAKDTDLGPRALDFYATYGGLSAGAARLQLLADLDTSFEENGIRVKQKGALLRLALGTLTVGLVIAALLIALDRPSKVGTHARCSTATATAPTAAVRSASACAFPASAHANTRAVPGAARGSGRRH